ncbi:ATP-binding protein [Streptomyces sp. 1222.5]|uniref:ATP-binding protein n=1 Tax=Streptomyces sp. 1222.5 TaxID=1881026 RepID=UPI003EBFF3A3
MSALTVTRTSPPAPPASSREYSRELHPQFYRYDYALPHHATAAAVARRTVKSVLAFWGLNENAAYDALVVVSEMVTNAVEHALPPIALHLQAVTATSEHITVRIDVTDGGPVTRPRAADYVADEHGRGQQLVAAIAVATGSRRFEHSTDYWAVLKSRGRALSIADLHWQDETYPSDPALPLNLFTTVESAR